jgi:hypothetical protein
MIFQFKSSYKVILQPHSTLEIECFLIKIVIIGKEDINNMCDEKMNETKWLRKTLHFFRCYTKKIAKCGSSKRKNQRTSFPDTIYILF